jgi:hypothetical protein
MEPGPSYTVDAFRREPPPGGLWRGYGGWPWLSSGGMPGSLGQEGVTIHPEVAMRLGRWSGGKVHRGQGVKKLVGED